VPENEPLEFEALRIISEHPEPIGSLALCQLLKTAGLSISPASTGRLLSRFDYEQFTVRHGFRGRLLTEKGESRLDDLRVKRRLKSLSSDFYNTLDAGKKSSLIDILVARRGIEREIAQLAAVNANLRDINNIKRAYENQAEKSEKGALTFESDFSFHRAIANAGKNSILAAAYDFVWQNGKFSPVMEYIRNRVGSKLVDEHGKILNAIMRRDSAEAELAMASHIENLIEDVNNYWVLVSNKRKNAVLAKHYSPMMSKKVITL
jgi:GntR family L-lactate dehydrogenase operon transcriptional regulator